RPAPAGTEHATCLGWAIPAGEAFSGTAGAPQCGVREGFSSACVHIVMNSSYVCQRRGRPGSRTISQIPPCDRFDIPRAGLILIAADFLPKEQNMRRLLGLLSRGPTSSSTLIDEI